MDKRQIQITISAGPGGGKTASALLIAEAFRSAGFQVTIFDHDVNNANADHEARMKRSLDALADTTEVMISVQHVEGR